MPNPPPFPEQIPEDIVAAIRTGAENGVAQLIRDTVEGYKIAIEYRMPRIPLPTFDADFVEEVVEALTFSRLDDYMSIPPAEIGAGGQE